MEHRIIKRSTHVLNNDIDGYVFNHNISDGLDFSSHLHKCYEFIKVYRGELRYTVEGIDYSLSEGDFVMTKPSELHSFSFPKDCVYERSFLHIYPGMLAAHPELKRVLDMREAGYFNCIPAELAAKHGIDAVFSGLYRWCAEPVPETDYMVMTYIMQLITIIGRILREEKAPAHAFAENKKAEMVMSFINKNFTETVALNDISRAVYLSPSYISRMFKRETGMTIKEYLTMRRITHAKNAIMQGGKVTAVFRDCGFSDYSTFYRAFMKYVGMSPEEFRRSVSRGCR